MSNFIKKAMEHKMSRKTFLGWAAGLTTAAVAPSYGLKKIDAKAAAEQYEEEGEMGDSCLLA